MKTNGFYEQEYATKREVIDIATQIASSLINDSDEIKGKVLFFADLPSASLCTNQLWIVEQSSGSWLTLNYKQSGIYKSNGTTWSLLDSTDDIISSFNTKADKTITISAGSGLTGGGDLSSNKTISHADTSSQANVINSNGNVIESITFDTFGHVQSVTSTNLDTRYTIANLGATTVGANLFTLPNPNATTFLRINADNTVSALNITNFQLAIGASATATANSLVLRDSVGSFLATNGGFSGQVAITRTWDGADSKGQLYLTGLTGNRIDYANIGLGLPTTTTRSVGTKIVYRSGLNSTDTDYATGINTNIFWHSIPNTTASFNWYASTTNIASLSGNGVFTALSFVKSGGLSTQFLKADGSVDSNSYLPSTGGTMSGNIVFNVGQTWPNWSISQGGTGATNVSDARVNLGLGSAAILNAGVANGVATLDSSGTIPLSQIPSSLQGSLQYIGTWNAATNNPTLVSNVGTKGYYYVVSVDGATTLNGISDWKIGDWAIFNGSIWQKIDNTDSVASVNGLTGAVVLTTTNVAEGVNAYYTDTRARNAISSLALGLTYTTSSGVFSLTTGYSIPTITSQANWDTAYAQTRQWDGGSTGLVPSLGRTSLGATTLGSNLFTLTNPSAVTFLRINGDNSISALDATTFRGAISAGTITSVSVVTANGISGSVATSTTTPAITLTLGAITPTSVNGLTLTSATTGFAIAGGTTSKTLNVNNTLTLSGTDSSTLNIGSGGTLGSAAFTNSTAYQSAFTSQLANLVFASPNGSAGVPTFRSLVATDIPTLNQNTTGTAANVTGIVAVANGGTGANNTTTARTNLGAFGGISTDLNTGSSDFAWAHTNLPDTSTDFNSLQTTNAYSRIGSLFGSTNGPFGNQWYSIANMQHRGGGGADGSLWGSVLAIGLTANQTRAAFRTKSSPNGITTYSEWREIITTTTGTGTSNTIPKFTGAGAITNGSVTDDGTTVKATAGRLVFATSGTDRGTIRTATNEIAIESQGAIHFNYYGGGFGGAQSGRAPVYFWKGSNYGSATIPTEAFHIEGVAGQSRCYGNFLANTFQSTGTWDAANTAGQIYLNGLTGNRIEFNTIGQGFPTFTTRSVGTKIVLHPNIGTSTVDYAIGFVAAGSDYGMWNSIPASNANFYWYAGTTQVATLSGAGAFTANGKITQNGNYRATGPNIAVGDANYGLSSFNSMMYFYSGTNGYAFTSAGADGAARTNIMTIDNTGAVVCGSVAAGGAQLSRIWAGFPLNGTGTARINVNSFGTNFIDFHYLGSATPSGQIYYSTPTGTVVYATTSDYRLKRDIKPIDNAIEKILALKPCNFKMKGAQESIDGFLAHELKEVVNYAAFGEKDVIDKDGNIIPQMIDSSKLIPLLTKALQNSIIRIKNLEKMIQNSSVMQTLQVVKSNVSTYSNIAVFTDLDGLSLTITPSSTASKFLIRATITFSIAGATTCLFRFVRNEIPVGIGNSGVIDASFGGAPANTAWATTVTGEYLDSPNTVSAIVYKIQFLPYDKNRIVVINRTFNGVGVDNGQRISTLTIQEIL